MYCLTLSTLQQFVRRRTKAGKPVGQTIQSSMLFINDKWKTENIKNRQTFTEKLVQKIMAVGFFPVEFIHLLPAVFCGINTANRLEAQIANSMFLTWSTRIFLEQNSCISTSTGSLNWRFAIERLLSGFLVHSKLLYSMTMCTCLEVKLNLTSTQ